MHNRAFAGVRARASIAACLDAIGERACALGRCGAGRCWEEQLVGVDEARGGDYMPAEDVLLDKLEELVVCELVWVTGSEDGQRLSGRFGWRHSLV